MIVFAVLAHREPELLARLVRRLSPHPVLVHLDLKTSLTQEWASTGATFIEHRRPVYWGGMSIVDATTDLLRAAVEVCPDASHVVLLSGTDYPIAPLHELEQHLDQLEGTSLITFMDAAQSAYLTNSVTGRHYRDAVVPWRLVARHRLFFQLDRIVRKALSLMWRPLPSRRWPMAFPAQYGNQFWGLSMQAVRHLLDFGESPDGATLRRFARRCQAPDEIYVHSVMAASGLPMTRGQVPYVSRGNFLTANLHLIHPSLGKWYSLDDLTEIESSGRYFVRKVSTECSVPLLDELDRRHSPQGRGA